MVRHGARVDPEVVAILHVDDADRASAWWLRLGFERTWTHRFSDNAPAFVEVRSGSTRGFLSGHEGAARLGLPHPRRRPCACGQAPGIQAGEARLPWRGRAGKTLRRWFDLDEDTFYSTFYCASVTRCYPGRAASGRGDRTPTPREQELC